MWLLAPTKCCVSIWEYSQQIYYREWSERGTDVYSFIEFLLSWICCFFPPTLIMIYQQVSVPRAHFWNPWRLILECPPAPPQVKLSFFIKKWSTQCSFVASMGINFRVFIDTSKINYIVLLEHVMHIYEIIFSLTKKIYCLTLRYITIRHISMMCLIVIYRRYIKMFPTIRNKKITYDTKKWKKLSSASRQFNRDCLLIILLLTDWNNDTVFHRKTSAVMKVVLNIFKKPFWNRLYFEFISWSWWSYVFQWEFFKCSLILDRILSFNISENTTIVTYQKKY